MEFRFAIYAEDGKILSSVYQEGKQGFNDLTIDDINKLEEVVKLAKEQMVKIAESNKSGMTL